MDNNNTDINDSQEEVKTFSLKKSGIILASVILLIIIVMLVLRSCVVTKEVETDDSVKNKTEVVLTEESNTTEKESENIEKVEIPEESSKNSSSESMKGEGNTGKIQEKDSLENSSEIDETEKVGNTVNEPSKGVSKDDGKTSEDEVSEKLSNNLFEVDVPVLGESSETSTIVSGKDAYLVDSSYYTYSISLIFPKGDEFKVVKYFCSKKIYDAVVSGETVNAVYQVDENGLISITSISR